MLIFSFLNQTLWRDPHSNRLSETIPMSGHTIGFGWEIRKLAFWNFSVLQLLLTSMLCLCVEQEKYQSIPDDLGRDINATQSYLKKHEGFENELAALEGQVSDSCYIFNSILIA